MSEEIPYAYQLRHHEQEVERLGTEIDRQRVEIAKLKSEIKELKLTLGWGAIVADNLLLRPDDKEYIRQGHVFVKQADEAAK